jgi:Ca2+-binding RTX toxin-like protein
MVRLVPALAALALLAPSQAGAATLTLDYLRTDPVDLGGKYSAGRPARDVYTVRFQSTGAADDVLTVDGLGRVRDDGAALDAGPGCAVDAGGWGVCAAQPLAGHVVGYELALSTGDGNDRVVVEPARAEEPITIDLGAGDDSADVRGAQARVSGGPGADRLAGPATAPFMRPYAEARATPLVWDGGPGPDAAEGDAVTVTYANATTAVRVTPDGVADDGAPGEGDDVGADAAAIVGGPGSDELHSSGWVVDGGPGGDHIVGADGDRAGRLGTETPETLYGGDGDDVIDARGGRDALQGGLGNDRLLGGDGADVLEGSNAPGDDVVDGGPGDDEVFAIDDGFRDVWIGGPGRDRWFMATPIDERITVSLDGRANDGLGDDDVRPDWEDVGILRGHLVGSNGPDRLEVAVGGSIDGRGGDDVLVGGGTLVGGRGHDVVRLTRRAHRPRVDVRDGGRDDVTCEVPVLRLRRDRQDRIRGCYALAQANLIPGRRRLVRGGAVRIAVACPGPQACRGIVHIRSSRRGSHPIAAARFRVPARRARRLTLRLGARAASLRASCGVAVIVVTTSSPYARGQRERITATHDLGTPPHAPARCRT